MQSQQPHHHSHYAPPAPMTVASMQQHPHHPPAHPHPPPPPTAHSYYPQHHHQLPPQQYAYQDGGAPMAASAGALSPNGLMRFPIPVTPTSMAGARPHKKDIKRRTKTGCLTCRQRRIKCDETHPACRNCEKSKRECLGYDPIFRQESGHVLIQPAPPSTHSASSTPTAHSSTLSPLPSAAYPPLHPHSGAAEAPLAGSTYLHGLDLDPALGGGDLPLAMPGNNMSSTLQPTRTPKHIIIDQLFSLHDIPPNYQLREAPLPNTTIPQQHIDDFYRFHFAQGLDRLFETKWYSTRGTAHLRHDAALVDFVIQCMQQFQGQGSDPSAPANALQSLEARLVWLLATMPRSSTSTSLSNPTPTNAAKSDPELLRRIDTLEYLLTGQYLPTDRIPAPATDTANHAHYNEQLFWHQLGTFTSLPDNSPDPVVLRAVDESLGSMRPILGLMENRDVLYSLALLRHLGGRLRGFHPQRPVLIGALGEDGGGSEEDLRKLEVARRFVEVQDQKGTTQVIQRVCGMGIRALTLQVR